MTLYEIDQDIRFYLSLMEPDETGMLPDNYEQLFDQLQNLNIQRQRKLENVAKYIINTRSEIASIKEEEKRLAERRKIHEAKEKRLLEYLNYACAGQKTSLGIATFSYRNTERVEIRDYETAIRYLSENNHSNCIRTAEPEISKSEVKALLKSGEQVPGIEIVKTVTGSLR